MNKFQPCRQRKLFYRTVPEFNLMPMNASTSKGCAKKRGRPSDGRRSDGRTDGRADVRIPANHHHPTPPPLLRSTLSLPRSPFISIGRGRAPGTCMHVSHGERSESVRRWPRNSKYKVLINIALQVRRSFSFEPRDRLESFEPCCIPVYTRQLSKALRCGKT